MSTKHSIQSDGPPCTYVTEAKTRANHFSVESGLSLCHEEVQDDEGEGGEAEVDGAEACGAADVCHGEGGGGAVDAGARLLASLLLRQGRTVVLTKTRSAD